MPAYSYTALDRLWKERKKVVLSAQSEREARKLIKDLKSHTTITVTQKPEGNLGLKISKI